MIITSDRTYTTRNLIRPANVPASMDSSFGAFSIELCRCSLVTRFVKVLEVN